MNMRSTLFFICLIPTVFAQQWSGRNAGVKCSFLMSIGTHQTAFGIGLNAYAAIENVQVNWGTTYRFFEHNLGDRCHFGEWRHTIGAVFMAGKKENPINFEWDGALHQSNKPFSLGYAYIWYFDKVGSTQRSGTWNIGVDRIDIQFENDVFGGQAKDRFRTGNLFISYRDAYNKAGIGIQIWTGETKFSHWNRDASPKMPSGYRDLTSLSYGNLNHGNIYVEYKHFEFQQIAGMRLGVDSENVRHLFQNRISHDLIFFPKKIERNTPHYPRLDENGKNVFSRDSVRKSKPYFKVFLNDGLLY